jgi:hypothetical protein
MLQKPPTTNKSDETTNARNNETAKEQNAANNVHELTK